MAEQGAGTDNQVAGGQNIQLRLNTLENSRKSFGRIIRMYMRGEIDRTTFRDLAYGMTAFLGYWRTEREFDIEERLAALEKQSR